MLPEVLSQQFIIQVEQQPKKANVIEQITKVPVEPNSLLQSQTLPQFGWNCLYL